MKPKKISKKPGVEMLVYINPDGREKNINPFDHGSAMHTDIMKTQALKKALDLYGFDAAFGGARRDEETSRAKERIISVRNRFHQSFRQKCAVVLALSGTPFHSSQMNL